MYSMTRLTKVFAFSVAALAISGTANAATCSAMQKEVNGMGKALMSLSTEREDAVIVFEHHNNERASATADLQMAQMTKSDKAEALQETVALHDVAAEEAKTRIDELNVALMEKNESYNAMVEAFNKKCVG